MTRFRRGFTLVEMLIVISIIGMLASLMLPAALNARENGRKVRCSNNLHQIMVGMTNYETQYRTFPPGRVGCDCEEWGPCKDLAGAKRPGTSGFALILPHIDEAAIFSLFRNFAKGGVFPGDSLPRREKGDEGDSSVGWTSASCGSDSTSMGWDKGNFASVIQALTARPQVFVCSSDRVAEPPKYGPDQFDSAQNDIRPAVGSYAMNMGPLGPDTYNESIASGMYQTYNDLTTTKITMYKKLGQSGPVQVKYQNLGPFVYYFARGSQHVTDGLSTTIFIGEVKDGTDKQFLAGGAPNRWAAAWAMADSLRSTYNGIDYSENYRFCSSTVKTGREFAGYFGSYHGPGANFVFGDGHTSYLMCSIDMGLLYALSTINNGYYEGSYRYDSTGNTKPIILP